SINTTRKQVTPKKLNQSTLTRTIRTKETNHRSPTTITHNNLPHQPTIPAYKLNTIRKTLSTPPTYYYIRATPQPLTPWIYPLQPPPS
ncbi:MAG: hypothetical protein QW707_06395, partial [Candidatus Bathyarchaeia archaeon]